MKSEATYTATVSNPYPNKGKPAGAIIGNSTNLDGDCICSYDYDNSTSNRLLFVFVKRGTVSGATLSPGLHRFAIILIY